MTDVLLICMPFGPHTSPSIALSLLKAQLTREHIDCAVRYFSIDFAELIGETKYSDISTDSGRPAIRELAGEWLFRDALFGTESDPSAYVDEILRKRAAWPRAAGKKPLPQRVVERLLSIREHIEPFLERCADEVCARAPKVIGFTSVFQQHVASLALARKIRARLPDAFIVAGGANCEAVMGAETLRQFEQIDAVVSGEGDLVFPELVRRVLADESVDDLRGVFTRSNVDAAFASGTFPNAPVVMAMDALPHPDYTDFFAQFEASALSDEWQPGLYFETSRGCWWGEKMHCTFCGLNGSTMNFRSKSPTRALEELTALATTYPGCDVQVTDNILDLAYFKDFLPALGAAKLPVDLFYETKANLTKAQVRALANAGIRKIQPGIESLSDDVLKLMRKGVSAIQNIQLLKWCKELGVQPYWNLLWGFPGEDEREYAHMAALVPQIAHFPAPIGIAGLRLDRFSPNFVNAEQFGFANVRPLAPYRHIYAFEAPTLSNLAYYFDFDYREPRDVGSYVAPLLRAVRAWQKRDAAHELLAFDNGDHVAVWDLRENASAPLTVLRGVDRALYLACDGASDLRSLRECVPSADAADIADRLQRMVAMGLLLQDRNRFLSLAVPVGDYQPSAETMSRLDVMAQRFGRVDRNRTIVQLDDAMMHVRPRSSSHRVSRVPRRRGLPAFVVNDHNELVMQW